MKVLPNQNFYPLKFQNKNKFMTQPLNFKGALAQDTIEINTGEDMDLIRRREELRKKLNTYYRQKAETEINTINTYFKRKKESPNSAFLYDVRIPLEEREIMLKNDEKFVKVMDLELSKRKVRPCTTQLALYRNSRFFDFDMFKGVSYVNTYDKTSRQNLEILQNSSFMQPLDTPGLESNFTMREISEYIKNGYLKPLKLTDIKTGEEIPVPCFDPQESKEAIERHNILTPSKSKYFQKWTDKSTKPNYIPASYLVKNGFGTPQILYKAINKGLLDGKIETIETPQGRKYRVFVNFNTDKSKTNLRIIRNSDKKIIEFNELLDLLEMDKKALQDDIVSGKLTPISDYLLDEPEQKLFIDLKDKQNLDYVIQKFFENEAKDEILKKEKVKKGSINSLRGKLAYYFSPNTKAIASELAKGDGYLISIFQKQDEILKYNRAIKENCSTDEELEPEKMELSKKEEIKLKSYYKHLWEIAGTQEIKEGYAKANEIIEQYLTFGLKSIEDENVRKIIQEIMK